MMDTTVKIIAQELNSKTGEVVNQQVVFEKLAVLPKKINELGFNHQEQIEIIRQSQNAILHVQQSLINENASVCPECGKKARKSGKFDSDFHSVFTDHKVKLQRYKCTCGWTGKISIDGIYGSALHPDLVELQALLGSKNSFKQTEEFLTKRSAQQRPINSHSRIQRTVNHVGKLLTQIKQGEDWAKKAAANEGEKPDELILVIDGAHIKSKDVNKRSFEAITGTIYNPKHRVKKDKHHWEILSKTVVASAKQDKQKSIKKMITNAGAKQGMRENTKLTVLTDGAKNCWSAASDIISSQTCVVTILDWFHIAMKFTNRESIIPDELSEEFKKSKWCLWHGDIDKALAKLDEIKLNLDENKTRIKTLINYLKNNREHIVNYAEREKSGEAFTSQLAESTVNNLVNERQKHDKRMQWSREGSDNVLQIRSSKQSGDWEVDWSLAQKLFYREAV